MTNEINYTEDFNIARLAAGRQMTDWNIVQLHEGTILACGCTVTNANGHKWSVRHWRETCRSTQTWRDGETQRVECVGDSKHVSGVILDEQRKIFASLDPFAGLWPHETKVR